jgi:organic hydroperoxide reductase OsmC/OhrA
LTAVTVTTPKVFEYAVEVDRGGRMTVPGGAQIAPPEGWSPDHLLLAALVRCSIDSLAYHARRAGHAVSASGSAQGTVAVREADGRYALAEADVRIDAQLEPRAPEATELAAKAERDCFVGASLTVTPRYEWHVS